MCLSPGCGKAGWLRESNVVLRALSSARCTTLPLVAVGVFAESVESAEGENTAVSGWLPGVGGGEEPLGGLCAMEIVGEAYVEQLEEEVKSSEAQTVSKPEVIT